MTRMRDWADKAWLREPDHWLVDWACAAAVTATLVLCAIGLLQ